MKALITVAILSISLLISCKPQVEKQSASNTKLEKLDVGSFNKKLVEIKNVQLIDVRTPAEVAAGAIPGAVNIDFYDDQFEKKIGALDPNRPIMVYCKSGGRSGKSAQALKKMGCKEVYDLAGGYTAWSSNASRK